MKWIVVLAIFAVTWFWLGMAINGMVSLSEAGGTRGSMGSTYRMYAAQAFNLLLVEAVAIVVTLSVWKPWGKVKPLLQLRQRTIVILVALMIVSVGVNVGMNLSMLNKYRGMTIADTDLSVLEDRIYRGGALCGSFTYEAEAEVENHQLIRLSITKNRDSPFALFAEGVVNKILKNQTPNVDAITGATTTSKCLMKAVEQTLLPD